MIQESAENLQRGSNSPFIRWWHSTCGPREVLVIALPLIVSTMSFSVMHFCDRMFLAWYSTAALGASVSAGALMWTLFSLPMGIASYATTFVAQYHGAGRPERIGRIVWQALRIGLYCIPIFLAIALMARQIFTWAGHSAELIVHEAVYFQTLAFGAGAVVLAAAQNAFFIGRGKTRIIMVTDVLAALLNIILDGWLIFGGLGLPAMGIAGAGIATSISMWFKVVVYGWAMAANPKHRVYQLRKGRCWDGPLTRRLFHFGAPNGLQFLLEGGAITIFVLLIGKIGATSAAATAVAFSVNMVAFVPVWGLAMAVTAMVGQRIGARQPELAAKASWTSLFLGLAYCSIFAIAYVAVPDWFLMAHASVGDGLADIHGLIIVLLRFVAAYCLFDAVQLVFVSAIKGAGDTMFVLLVTIGSTAAFLMAGRIISQSMTSETDLLFGWWAALTGWVILLAIIYTARFLQGKWKSMNVIEIGDPDDGSDLG